MKPAIVLSAHTMGYAVIRSLASRGIPVICVYYDKYDFGQFSKYVYKKVLAPHPETNEEEFISLLIDVSKKENGGMLIPTNDETLLITAKNKGLLSEHFTVAFNSYSIVEKLINKKYTYELAIELGVPIPHTIFPVIEEEVKFDKELNYPVIIKPIISHQFYAKFNRKFFLANDLSELLRYFKEVKKNNIEVIMQESIPGVDSNMVMYNSYYINGNPVLELTAEKVRNGPSVYGNSRVSVTKQIPEIIEPARKFLGKIGYSGYSCAEFKKDDRDGNYKFLEVNGRYNLSAYLLAGASMNIPWIEYEHLMLNKIPKRIEFTEEIYWIDIVRDICYTLYNLKTERYTFRQYIEPYFRSHVFAVLDWKDPLTFIKRITSVIREIKEIKLKGTRY